MKKMLGAALALGLLAAALAVVGYGSAPGTRTVIPRGNSTLGAAKAFRNYPLYFSGPEVGGFELSSVERQVGPGAAPDERGVDWVMFTYGTCDVRTDRDGGSCTVPVVIQIWPACFRNPSVYPFAPDESITIRGVPAVFYEGGNRLELTIGDVTAVIFGHTRELLLEAARTLRGVNNPLSETAGLVPPKPLTAC
jgi:hypothetical protein